jgi:hypothetical protein
MSDAVTVETTSQTDDVSISFVESASPVSVSSPITVDSVVVESAANDGAVTVNVTSEIDAVSVSCDEVVQPITVNVSSDSDNVSVEVATGAATWVSSFDTVNRNLSSYPYQINYSGDTISSIVFNLGLTTITKTFGYTSGILTSIVLSGDTPQGISLTKTFGYTGDKITSVTYT